jgi:uncharacterized membrane protein
MNTKTTSSFKRSLLKGISWETISFIITLFAVYLIYGDISFSVKFTGILTIIKIVLFFLHERLWKLLKWGKKNKGINVDVIKVIEDCMKQEKEDMGLWTGDYKGDYFDLLPVGTRLNYKDGTPAYEKCKLLKKDKDGDVTETNSFVWRSVQVTELVKEPVERYWFKVTDWQVLNDLYYKCVFNVVLTYRM